MSLLSKWFPEWFSTWFPEKKLVVEEPTVVEEPVVLKSTFNVWFYGTNEPYVLNYYGEHTDVTPWKSFLKWWFGREQSDFYTFNVRKSMKVIRRKDVRTFEIHYR